MYYLLVFGLLGAVAGSFAGAQVWRLRARQLQQYQSEGEQLDGAEKVELKRLKPLLGRGFRADRSSCLSCGHQLSWSDMIPIISWLGLGGRCRYCRQPIGWAELLLELSLAGLFMLSVWLWPASLAEPIEMVKLGLWLISLVIMAISFVYDLRWYLLLDRLTIPLAVVGALFAAISLYQTADIWQGLASLAGSLAILSGLYFLINKISNNQWSGLGDAKLGVGLALLLLDWRLAFIALFGANLVGTIIVLPGLISGKISRKARVPFGPLMIVGFLIAWFLGPSILDWYQGLLFI